MTIAECGGFWISTFALVFLMGFQSRSVNSGKFVSAGLTSLAIGAAQLVVVRGMASQNPWATLALTGTAGPVAIVSAMALHARLHRQT